MYGGAAGGGKSDALIMDALQYAHCPGYSALLLRRTFPDLNLPGAIMHRAKAWLLPHGVRWNDRDKTFTFEGGAQLTFGYLETEKDKYRYQGSEYQYVGFDEGTQFEVGEYLYLMSRNRRTADIVDPLTGDPVPLRMRMATNPGNIGHEWVRGRFVPATDAVTDEPVYPRDEQGEVRVFVPARLSDNPHLNAEEYARNLAELDPVTREQLLNGDWGVRPPGEMFDAKHLGYIDRDQLPRDIEWARGWDLAGTKKRPNTRREPDWTRGVLMGYSTSTQCVYVGDVEGMQGSPSEVERLVVATAERDRIWPGHRRHRLDLEPGSSGIAVADHYLTVLRGYDFEGVRPTGPKSERARPFAAYWRAGRVMLVRAPWNGAYVAELQGFPNEGLHDDQVDASSLAFQTVIGTYSSGSATIEALAGRSNPYHAQRGRGLRLVSGGRR